MPDIRIISFSYRHANPPADAVVYDCRTLANPHYDNRLKKLDGRDPLVQQFIASRDHPPRLAFILYRARQSAKDGATVAFGCVGGRHRSVAVAEMLAKILRDVDGNSVQIEHRALQDH